MEFRPCPECGRIVGSDRINCPYCHVKLPPPPEWLEPPRPARPHRRWLYRFVFAIFPVVIAATFVITMLATLMMPPCELPPSPTSGNVTPAWQSQQPALPPAQGEAAIPPQAAPTEKQQPETSQPPAPVETQERVEQPETPPAQPLTPEERRLDQLLAQARTAWRDGQWSVVIAESRRLLELLGTDSPGADEIENLLNRAEIQLELNAAEGLRKNILSGLVWLADHQDMDGRWDQNGFTKHCRKTACGGEGTSQYDAAVTGLALLAFIRNGYTHKSGLFQDTVKAGLYWLVETQRKDGSIHVVTGKTGELPGAPEPPEDRSGDAESWIYNHPIATLALCEAYAATKDPDLKGPAQKAVDFILVAQNPGLGWKYEPQDGRNDTSVTGWMVLALNAARSAGLEFQQSAFDGAVNWLDRATNTAGKTGYMRPGDDGSVIRGVNEHYAKLPTMTAVAAVCRIVCGQPQRDPKVIKGIDILMYNLPDWNWPKCDKVDMYYWYYGTLAASMYKPPTTNMQEKPWHIEWRKAVLEALLPNQRFDGCADGSWDPVGKWGMVGGRVYSTAICVLILRTLSGGRLEIDTDMPEVAERPKPSKWLGREVTLVLSNGNHVEGQVTAEDMTSVTLSIGTGISWRIDRKEISEIKPRN
jgi:hypothetical protein